MQQRFKEKKKSGYSKAIFLAGVVYNPSDKKAALLPTTWYQKLKLTKGSWYLGKTWSEDIIKQDMLSHTMICPGLSHLDCRK